MKKYLKLLICIFAVTCLFGCGAQKYTLEEYIDDNKAAVEALSNSIYDAELIARDGSVVYKYTYKTTYKSEQVELMKKSLDAGIKEQEDVFKAAYEEVKKLIPSTKSVIVEYYNGDNTLISSTEFK